MKRLFCLILFVQFFHAYEASAQDAPTLGHVTWNHLALQVKDIEASKAFYKDIIGLKPVQVPDDLKAIRGWFDIGNGQMIHLLAGRTTPVVNDKNGSHFSIFIDSIDQAEKFLTAKNLKFHKQVRFDKVTQIYFEDPDGYLIELNQRAK
ncbi:Catechol 2,3-dioxygenase [Dyadobacter koreensis]|uniref:Catechol 2,3-dioxygenase n=1 Tax=Dyadobacter koreensis TaxID=408657 RepID=A0A1H6QUW1_9BACT|nr:VOC family protein [Dyadobacter koreensis]SEI43987.1 Catechol 2,3-dioxygenase [Dyadobacter koreensis]